MNTEVKSKPVNSFLKRKLYKVLISGSNYITDILGVSFKEALTKKDLDTVYKVRYKVYLHEGYIIKSSSQMFSDKYDEHSVNLIILKKNLPIGTVRIILNSDIPFWTESLFNFTSPVADRDKLGEVSRLAIMPKYRGGKRLIMMGLIKQINEYSLKLHLDYLYINVPAKLARYIESFGIPLIKLEQNRPTAENIQSRKPIEGYFNKHNLEPYLIDLSSARDKFN